MHSWLFSSYASGYITVLGDITSGIHSSAVTVIVTYLSLLFINVRSYLQSEPV